MMTHSEVWASPFFCCGPAGRGDLVSAPVLSSAALGFDPVVELLSLANLFWLTFSCLKLKEEFGFPLALESQVLNSYCVVED